MTRDNWDDEEQFEYRMGYVPGVCDGWGEQDAQCTCRDDVPYALTVREQADPVRLDELYCHSDCDTVSTDNVGTRDVQLAVAETATISRGYLEIDPMKMGSELMRDKRVHDWELFATGCPDVFTMHDFVVFEELEPVEGAQKAVNFFTIPYKHFVYKAVFSFEGANGVQCTKFIGNGVQGSSAMQCPLSAQDSTGFCTLENKRNDVVLYTPKGVTMNRDTKDLFVVNSWHGQVLQFRLRFEGSDRSIRDYVLSDDDADASATTDIKMRVVFATEGAIPLHWI
eukprot:3932560-Rhodomonas_salina.1